MTKEAFTQEAPEAPSSENPTDLTKPPFKKKKDGTPWVRDDTPLWPKKTSGKWTGETSWGL